MDGASFYRYAFSGVLLPNPDPEAFPFPNARSSALWWTAMLLTTMGSDYWPQTPEGRLLCLVLAIYAFAVFGYVTAAIAAYFVGKDRDVGLA